MFLFVDESKSIMYKLLYRGDEFENEFSSCIDDFKSASSMKSFGGKL